MTPTARKSVGAYILNGEKIRAARCKPPTEKPNREGWAFLLRRSTATTE